MAIIASYFLNDNWFTSAAHSMIAIDALVKLNLTQAQSDSSWVIGVDFGPRSVLQEMHR